MPNILIKISNKGIVSVGLYSVAFYNLNPYLSVKMFGDCAITVYVSTVPFSRRTAFYFAKNKRKEDLK